MVTKPWLQLNILLSTEKLSVNIHFAVLIRVGYGKTSIRSYSLFYCCVHCGIQQTFKLHDTKRTSLKECKPIKKIYTAIICWVCHIYFL